MRNQYKVLAEKYSMVQETREDDLLNMGMFGSDLWDLIKKFPDKREFVDWLLANLPIERIPDHHLFRNVSYTRDYYGIDSWIDDLARAYARKNGALNWVSVSTANKQAEANILYKKFQAYKHHLNKDNPGVPSEY